MFEMRWVRYAKGGGRRVFLFRAIFDKSFSPLLLLSSLPPISSGVKLKQVLIPFAEGFFAMTAREFF